MGVRRPDWWFYPEQCAKKGNPWGPGLVLVSWERCHWSPARAAYPERHGGGHLTVACGVPVKVVLAAAPATAAGLSS
jgi:hypothetical protein